jgi:hypothetical protein
MTDWHALARALNRTMAAHAPGWSDRNDHDPGVTILEVLAYLSENLPYHVKPEDRQNPLSRIDAMHDDSEPFVVHVNGQRWKRVSTLAEAAPGDRVFFVDAATGTITFGDGVRGRAPEPGNTISARYRQGGAGNTSLTVRTTWPLSDEAFRISVRKHGTIQLETCAMLLESWSGRKRPNYFSGKRLSVDDFRDEQTYLVEKCRRHLRTLHGSGIVSGLQVEADVGGQKITVAPGLAIDAHGREIQMNEPATLMIPSQTSSPTLVLVEYVERLVDPVPVSPAGTVEANRIEEGCRVTLASVPDDDRVAIARVSLEQSGWRVDAMFAPPRVK